jgi:hypothetical protein
VKSERLVGVAGSFRDLRVSKVARAASAEVFEISKAFPRFSLTEPNTPLSARNESHDFRGVGKAAL